MSEQMTEPDHPGGRGAPEGAGFGMAEIPGLAQLRLIATTDLHGQLLSYDYFANRSIFGTGLAQIACLIAAARAGAGQSLLLDNGDFLQGTALVEPLPAGRRNRPGINPAIAAFNILGYDAVALGNHEFDFGLDHLGAALTGAGFPLLCANLALKLGETPLQDLNVVAPYALLRRKLTTASGEAWPVSIGILGLTPPETVQWNQRSLANRLEARPMEEAARAFVPLMRQQGADLVICLAHTGVPQPGHPPHCEAMAGRIAAIDGVDAVIAGHTHLISPVPGQRSRGGVAYGHIGGKPVVQPGQQGNALGLIDLWLRPEAGRWQLARSEVQVIEAPEAVAARPARALRLAAAPLRQALAADHRAALSSMRIAIGESKIPLHSWFALAAPSAALRLVAAAKIGHVRSRLAEKGLLNAPVIAIVNAFRCGGRGGPRNYTNIAAGPLSMRNVCDIYPFANTVTAEEITGLELLLRLERGQAHYRRLTPGRADQPLTDDSVPGFSLPMAMGVSYQIDLSRPALSGPGAGPVSAAALMAGEGRIRGLSYQGRRIRPEDRFILAGNSYRTEHTPGGPSLRLLDEGRRCSDVIAAYIRAGGPIGGEEEAWSFLPLPGTSVLFESGPGALGHLEAVAHLRPESLGLTDTGFYRFRLHL